jgi:hypothetical protein
LLVLMLFMLLVLVHVLSAQIHITTIILSMSKS